MEGFDDSTTFASSSVGAGEGGEGRSDIGGPVVAAGGSEHNNNVILAPPTHHHHHHGGPPHHHPQHHPHNNNGLLSHIAHHSATGGGGGASNIPCKFYAMGMCKYGESCRFAHFIPRGGWNGGRGRGVRGGHRGGRGGGVAPPSSPIATATVSPSSPPLSTFSQTTTDNTTSNNNNGLLLVAPPLQQQPQRGGFSGRPPFHQNRGGFVPRGGRGHYGGAGSGGYNTTGGGGYRGGGRGGGYHPPHHYSHGHPHHHTTSDQRPYGTPPGLNYEKKEEQKEQTMDYFLLLDLEGKQEILEFPVALVNAKTLEMEDIFHRYVRPVSFTEEHLAQYIQGKYGKYGLTEKYYAEAIPFTDTLIQFNEWLGHHDLLHSILRSEDGQETGEERQAPYSFLFVTCGNWDIKTQIPRQCAISKFDMPGYFHEWINIKDVYLNFYKHKALGLRAMLEGLGTPLQGEHRHGDVQSLHNIVRRMVMDGVRFESTATRAVETGYVTYKYQHRV